MRRRTTTRLVRWAFGVRVLSVLGVLLLPLTAPFTPHVALAAALLGCWSLLWLTPRDGTLAVARRRPLVVLGDGLVAVIVTGIVGVDSLLILGTLSSALVIGLLVRGWTAPLLLAALATGQLVVALGQSTGSGERWVHACILISACVVLTLLGRVVARLEEQMLLEQARLSHASAAAAAAAERARVAGDAHHALAKSLHGLALAAAALPRWVERDPLMAVEHAAVLRDAAEQAAREAGAMTAAASSRCGPPLAEGPPSPSASPRSDGTGSSPRD